MKINNSQIFVLKTYQMAITFDITATIIALAGAKAPKKHAPDGINLKEVKKLIKEKLEEWEKNITPPNQPLSIYMEQNK